jgi:isopenicillin N synthase-like dioxygenase
LTLGYNINRALVVQQEDDDLSVSYGLHYPNETGTGQSESENVFEHVDPSLYVIEPVTDVAGLDVFDRASQCWISVENECVPHNEWVLFCGKALERTTEARVRGTLHRVTRRPETANNSRFCYIYEQKYASFFE